MKEQYEVIGRRDFLKSIGLTAAVAAAPWVVAREPADKKMNVLFIAVDDLRTELGCYGSGHIKSQNIDRLASQGTMFRRAYCQQAVCNPSRVSLLTGMRPDTAQVWDLYTPFRKIHPKVVTLPQYFMNNGYHSQGMGKIYHMGHGLGDDPYSWSVKHQVCGRQTYCSPENQKIAKTISRANKGKDRKQRKNGPPTDCADVNDNQYGDGALTDLAVRTLNEIKDKAFFLAVGYRKPHLPFCAPKKYWDMYDPKDIEIPDRKRPADAPPIAFSNWGELRKYYGMPAKGPLNDDQTRHLIHGYYACVSFIDAQVGRLLDELDKLGLREDTVIVLWGDHGWKLGEYGDWCKHTNFELDAHAPLIFSVPGQKVKGKGTDALVEFIDIYPTLCDIAGLQPPRHLEGYSAKPLLDDPNIPWKTGAISQYPRWGNVMGYSIRTERYRYTEWQDRKTREVKARELYDQSEGDVVAKNIVEAHPDLAARFSEMLNGGYDKLLPSAGGGNAK